MKKLNQKINLSKNIIPEYRNLLQRAFERKRFYEENYSNLFFLKISLLNCFDFKVYIVIFDLNPLFKDFLLSLILYRKTHPLTSLSKENLNTILYIV